MSQRTITIFEEDIRVDRVVDAYGIDIVDDSNRIIEIITEGPRGPRGDRGEVGYSGAGEPFYVVVSGSLYATTSSLATFGFFSSSLNPTSVGGFTTFDLGGLNTPWRSLYVSESIFIVKQGIGLVEIRGSENAVDIGNSRITTGSFGFESPIISREAIGQQIMQVSSASVSMSFDDSGVFSIPSFSTLPSPVVGGLIMINNELYFGK